MARLRIDVLLEAATDREFFINVCSLLENYSLPGMKSSSELKIVRAQGRRSAFQFTLYVVLGHPYHGTVGYTRDEVWVFTLYADGELTWKVANYVLLDQDLYSEPEYMIVRGLDNIKEHLRTAENAFAKRLLSGALNRN